MKFIDRFFDAAERVSKVRTLTVLRELPENQLRDVGIDPNLLADGVRAWPWRSPEENWGPRQSVFKTSVGTRVGNVTVADECVENDKSAA